MNSLVSFLQSFAILLVVIGHTGLDINLLDKWIYSFHMPLFIFISGFLLKETTNNIEDLSIKYFVLKKSERLLLPYVVISSFAYFPKILLNKFAQRKIEFSIFDYIHGLFFPWDNPIIFFWFLPTIFLILVLFVVIYKIKKKFNFSNKLIVVLLIFLNILSVNEIKFLNLSGVLKYSIFFELGILFNVYQDKIKDMIKLGKIKTTIFLLLISFTNLFMKSESNKICIFLYQNIGILFSISLGYLYIRKKLKILNFLNGKSYFIYLYSWFSQVFIRILFIQILKINSYLTFICSIFAGIFFPILFISFFDKVIKNKFIRKSLGMK